MLVDMENREYVEGQGMVVGEERESDRTFSRCQETKYVHWSSDRSPFVKKNKPGSVHSAVLSRSQTYDTWVGEVQYCCLF